MPDTNTDDATRFARTFYGARHRMMLALRRRLLPATSDLAAIDSDQDLFCEHCPFSGNCSACGQVHP